VKEYPPPAGFIKTIQKWLRTRFNGPFQELGDSLAHGVQKDGISCLICSANTISHGVFGDPLWMANRRGHARAEWFLTLIQPITALVRALKIMLSVCLLLASRV
jgi:hypothetical protein